MDIYYKKRRWKQFLFLFAIFIGIGSLLYTNRLVKETSNEERLKIRHWVQGTKLLLENEEDLDTDLFDYIIEIQRDNTTIPFLLINEDGDIIDGYNFQYNENNKQKVLKRELEKLKTRQEPIEIPICLDDNAQDCFYYYLYYKESSLLTKLKYYPIFQIGVIALFIVAAYVAFSSARNAEQNLVWIGMAKETAHQLGTPISSLIAWVELLKEEQVNPSIIMELQKDTKRLEKITERFSKVGSQPELYPENLYTQLLNSISYLQTRISKKIKITSNFDSGNELFIPLSASLFSWVIENLVRNSVDAIENKEGLIDIQVFEGEREVYIDISDTGKGIPKSKMKTIFNPGFTTKKRGWGLGLSLSKRIIENYHKGKIQLKSSELNKGTTFRIVLGKHN